MRPAPAAIHASQVVLAWLAFAHSCTAQHKGWEGLHCSQSWHTQLELEGTMFPCFGSCTLFQPYLPSPHLAVISPAFLWVDLLCLCCVAWPAVLQLTAGHTEDTTWSQLQGLAAFSTHPPYLHDPILLHAFKHGWSYVRHSCRGRRSRPAGQQ